MNSKKNSTTRRMYVDLPPAMAAQYDRAMAGYNAAIAAGKTEEEAEQLFHQAMKAKMKPLSPLALQMLGLITQYTATSGYIASWHIHSILPETHDLDVACDPSTPGNAAMYELIDAGLVEHMPDLGSSRYRTVGLTRH